MKLDDMVLRPHPGEGLVARFPNIAVVVVASAPRHQAVADQVLAMAEAAAGDAIPRRRLARDVARLLISSEPTDVPGFGVLVQVDEDVVLFLHGPMDAAVSGPEGTEHLSGTQVATWVERVLAPASHEVVLTPSGSCPASPDPRTRLTAGVVLGGGLSMNGAPDEADDGAVTSATLKQLAPASVTVAWPDRPNEAEETRPPLPVARRHLPGAERSGRLVRGVICANGHFTNPENAYCHIDGISLVQSTLNVVEGPRPALGVLVLDDGSTLLLDADYVIGREPDHDPSVLSGESRPLTLTDAERTVSRVHAAVLLENWDVRVVDRGSANGTFILASAGDRWIKLIPDEPTTIKPGCQVRVGKREFLFESNLGRR